MQFSMEMYLDNTKVYLEGQGHKVKNMFFQMFCQVGGYGF